MIISPAKTLDLSSCDQRLCGDWTFPDCDEAKTKQVAAVLKNRTPKELASLLNISQNLAKTAHEVRRLKSLRARLYRDGAVSSLPIMGV